VAPYGIFLPELDELFLYFTESKVTSDFIVDILADFWESENGITVPIRENSTLRNFQVPETTIFRSN